MHSRFTVYTSVCGAWRDPRLAVLRRPPPPPQYSTVHVFRLSSNSTRHNTVLLQAAEEGTALLCFEFFSIIVLGFSCISIY